ncbi:MAG TPA: hypothetical protein VK000_10780 [Luteimonas sp.]|nr:hypothetical protein [Luteimonas sp.]
MVHDVHGPEVPEAPDPRRLLELLRADDVDAALAAGLMAVDADAAGDLDPASRELLAQAQQRLRAAWNARERYRLRSARLARRAAERDARRRAAAAPAAPSARPELPPAAAAALARARARAQRP